MVLMFGVLDNPSGWCGRAIALLDVGNCMSLSALAQPGCREPFQSACGLMTARHGCCEWPGGSAADVLRRSGFRAAPVEPAGRLVEVLKFVGRRTRMTRHLHFRLDHTPATCSSTNSPGGGGHGQRVVPLAISEAGRSFSRPMDDWRLGQRIQWARGGRVRPSALLGPPGFISSFANLPEANGPRHIFTLPTWHRAGQAYRSRSGARTARGLTVAIYRPGDVMCSRMVRPGVSKRRSPWPQGRVDFVSASNQHALADAGGSCELEGGGRRLRTSPGREPRALFCCAVSGLTRRIGGARRIRIEVMTWRMASRKASRGVACALTVRRRGAGSGAGSSTSKASSAANMAVTIPAAEYGEWFLPGTWRSSSMAYAPADTNAWRPGFRERYPHRRGPQTAWREPTATWAARPCPTGPAARLAERHPARPDDEKTLIDLPSSAAAMADLVCELAHAAREASHGRKLVVFFYGYVFESHDSAGPCDVRHYALRRVLDCRILTCSVRRFPTSTAGLAAAREDDRGRSVASRQDVLCEDDSARTWQRRVSGPVRWREGPGRDPDAAATQRAEEASATLRRGGWTWDDRLVQ